MPVGPCEENGRPGYSWGSQKCYTYSPDDEAGRKRAKRAAYIQGSAIEHNGGGKALDFEHMADALAAIRGEKFNPNHEPGGTPEGGRFASASGTTATLERPKAAEYKGLVSTSPAVRQMVMGEVADEHEALVRTEAARWPGLTPEITVVPNGSIGETNIADTRYIANGNALVRLTPHIFNSEMMGRPEREATAWVIAHEMAHVWCWRAYSDEQPGYADIAFPRPRAVTRWLESWVPKAAYAEMQTISDYGRDNGIIEAFAEAVGMYVSTGRVPGPETAKLFSETFRDQFYPMQGGSDATKGTKAAEADRGVPDYGRGARTGGEADALAEARAIVRGLKFNPNHEPGGSPEGGRFAVAGGGGGGGSRAPEDTPGQWQWFESRRSQLYARNGEKTVDKMHEHWASTYDGCDEMQDAAQSVISDPKAAAAAWQALDHRSTVDAQRSVFVERAAALMISDVNHGDDGVWWRGLNGAHEEFKVGQQVDIPLASASWSDTMAVKYAMTPVAKRGGLISNDEAIPIEQQGRVVLELHGKGSAQVWNQDMREIIVSGRYRVREIIPAGTFTDRGTIDAQGKTLPGSQRTWEKVEEPRRVILEQVGQFDVPSVSGDDLKANSAFWDVAKFRP